MSLDLFADALGDDSDDGSDTTMVMCGAADAQSVSGVVNLIDEEIEKPTAVTQTPNAVKQATNGKRTRSSSKAPGTQPSDAKST